MPRQPPLFETQLYNSGLSRLDFAAVVYHQRNLSKAELQARREGRAKQPGPYHPVGFNVGPKYNGKQALWIPHPLEVRPCCQVITPPVNKFPWVYHRHCRSVRHVAMLLNVDERDLKKIVKPDTHARCSCGKFRKAEHYACGKCLWKNRQDELDK